MGNKLANLSEHIKELNNPVELKKKFDAVNKKVVAIENHIKENGFTDMVEEPKPEPTKIKLTFENPNLMKTDNFKTNY